MIAGLVSLYFAGTVRSMLGRAEATIGGSGELARVAFSGAVTGTIGITTAVIMMAGATAVGGDADPEVSKAVATATVGPFLVGAMGFSAWLGMAGLITLRSRVLARWIGIVALVGSLAFFLTFFTLVVGVDKDSLFGYGFFVGFLALVIWSIATSLRTFRRMTTVNPDLSVTRSNS